MSRLGKQDLKSLLGKMMIVRQNFGNSQAPQGEHRAAIGQAVSLVGPCLIQRQRGIEIETRLRKDIDGGFDAQLVNQCGRLPAPVRSRSREPIQDFRQNFIRRHETSAAQSVAERHGPRVKGVAWVKQGYPVESIGEQHSRRHRPSLRPLGSAIEIMVEILSAIGRQLG
jgi:hypothetical protein